MLLYLFRMLSGRKIVQIIIVIVSIFHVSNSFSQQYIKIKAKKGDGIYGVLKENGLSPTEYLDLFIELNKAKLGKGNALIVDRIYRLPLKTKTDSVIPNATPVKEVNPVKEVVTVKIVIPVKAANLIKDIISARDIVPVKEAIPIIKVLPTKDTFPGKEEISVKEVITSKDIVTDQEVVPVGGDLLLKEVIPIEEVSPSKEVAQVKAIIPVKENISVKEVNPLKKVYEIYGKKYKEVTIKSKELAGTVYYLMSGHGGPDPGAIGFLAGHQLCEDEYAYDVTLRLARNLTEFGATVYMIIRDPNDGIRDESFLIPDKDEVCFPNQVIPLSQLARLRQSTDAVNKLYDQNKGKFQRLVIIHVDSRNKEKNIDVFFYHKKGSKSGEKLADKLKETFGLRYAIHQPSRGYSGSVTDRSLYVLRNALPTSVFIELGNINHTRDQQRFIVADNRQAVSNWLRDGLIEEHKKALNEQPAVKPKVKKRPLQKTKQK